MMLKRNKAVSETQVEPLGNLGRIFLFSDDNGSDENCKDAKPDSREDGPKNQDIAPLSPVELCRLSACVPREGTVKCAPVNQWGNERKDAQDAHGIVVGLTPLPCLPRQVGIFGQDAKWGCVFQVCDLPEIS